MRKLFMALLCVLLLTACTEPVQPDGNVNVYSGSADGVVAVASLVRDVASIDWLTWNVVVEIVDADGNTVYTESFMYKEYEDFANSIEFAIPMQ